MTHEPSLETAILIVAIQFLNAVANAILGGMMIRLGWDIMGKIQDRLRPRK